MMLKRSSRTRVSSMPGEPHEEHAQPFLDHLEELRNTLLWCVGALFVGVLLTFMFTPKILGFLMAPLDGLVENPQEFLRSLQVTGAFMVWLRIAAWSGLLISAPAIVYFLARFIFPGLKDREKDVMVKASGFAVLMFAVGVVFAYKVGLPISLKMMLKLHADLAVAAEWTVNDYVAFTTQLMIGFGLAFEMPVVVLVLGRLGIVTVDQLCDKRKHVFLVTLVVGMLLTPQDIASMFILAVPLYALFEMCVLILRFQGPAPGSTSEVDVPSSAGTAEREQESEVGSPAVAVASEGEQTSEERGGWQNDRYPEDGKQESDGGT